MSVPLKLGGAEAKVCGEHMVGVPEGGLELIEVVIVACMDGVE